MASIRARYVTGITTVGSLEDETRTPSADEAVMRKSEADYSGMEEHGAGVTDRSRRGLCW